MTYPEDHQTMFYMSDDDEPTVRLDHEEYGGWFKPEWISYIVFSHSAAVEYGFPYAVKTAATAQSSE